MYYEPSKGHGLPHDPFKALVSPRPIGWISTVGRNGALNLAPYSFFNALSGKPPLVWFSSEGEKDSATFAGETREFVANIVGRDLAEKMNRSSVNAPPAALECKVTEMFRPRALDGQEIGAFVVIGEVVGIHIDEAFLKEGLFDTVKAGNVARLGDMDYSTVDAVFSMRRPRWEK